MDLLVSTDFYFMKLKVVIQSSVSDMKFPSQAFT